MQRIRRVVSIISGGNMDIITMSSVVTARSNLREEEYSLYLYYFLISRVSLGKVADAIADVQGNVIKLEHNQFVSVNRNAAVELRVTLECFGHEHKKRIIAALEKKGYKPKEVRPNL